MAHRTFTLLAWALGLTVALILLGGCAPGYGAPPSYGADQSAAQIKAAISDKNINVVCSILPTPWGIGRLNVLSVDETSQTNATTSMKGDCSELSVTTVKPFPPPKPVADPVKP